MFKDIREKLKIYHWKVIALYLIIYDILAVNFSYFFVLLLRFDLHLGLVPYEYVHAYKVFTPWYTIFCLIAFNQCGLYKSLWRFASFNELNRILMASVVTTLFQIVGITAFVARMPVSYYVLGAILQFVLITLIRFSYRYITLERTKRYTMANGKENVMIIGAGAAGQQICRELLGTDKLDLKPVCFIDDNPNKWGRLIDGIPIVGGRDSIMDTCQKLHIDIIMLAMPSVSPKVRRDILTICNETGCQLENLPGLYQLANGEATLQKMKPVAVEDLLGRDEVKVNMDEIFSHISGKTILVTGGGGSIGSELCRQIAAHHPKQLIIFDIYENNAYDIEQELRRKYKDELNLVVLIGSVRDTERVNYIFDKYRPQLVYHAAAHKHVPLMEVSPNEAIKNNVVGTYKVAYAALQYNTERFVLISTDKAVNPTNVMGASKRICEMIIQCMDYISKEKRMDLLPILCRHEIKDVEINKDPITRFGAVRFGNVLGSNGSVVPLFKKQIADGGPVTVTHPDIVRYFMTIPEAVSLVLQAGVYATGGEIFVLDMGEPVKIDTLARNLIKLSALTPDVDIPIMYSGLRSGEKLYEERLMAEEGILPTSNEKIHIGKPIPFDRTEFLQQLQQLAKASYVDDEEIRKKVKDIVATYHF